MVSRYVSIINEENLENDKILNFSEYRKGSNKYGILIDGMMMWLRTYRKDNSNIIISNLDKFLKESNINKDLLIEFLNDIENTNLINFKISIENDQIKFYDLNKTNKNRYVFQ